MLLRLIIYGIIFAFIYFSLRRIILDWRNKFRDMDKQTRQRDLKERTRPDVIELERDADGVFRPGDKKGQ